MGAAARRLLGEEIVTVEVKQGLGRETALMLAPKKARVMIHAGAKDALGRVSNVAPYKPEFPLAIRWQLKDSGIVDRYQGDAMRIYATTLEKVVRAPQDIITP